MKRWHATCQHSQTERREAAVCGGIGICIVFEKHMHNGQLHTTIITFIVVVSSSITTGRIITTNIE
jgi:hypothetical protein